ncbi:MAG: transglycosylase SLT domain-containing protein [Bacteroidales bacterium]|nr:transglycosylase SLT domain-containing protein [Bacteroidales bacterium]
MRTGLVFIIGSLFIYQGFRINAQTLHFEQTFSSELVINHSLIPEVFQSPEQGYEYYIGLLDNCSPIDLEYNEYVEEYINIFLGKRKKDLELSLQRAQKYFPLFEEILDKNDLPLELKYVAVIESGLNPYAKSPSGAVGLWQFLYKTCSMLDLTVNSYIDERRDPYKSTEAACRYFKYLYATFNNWNLVLASYNSGPGEVRKAIARSGGKTDYWEIRKYLPEQAVNYVPAFVAINYLMNNYKRHGIEIFQGKMGKIKTDTVLINYSLSFRQISSVLDISIQTLQELNPTYSKDFIPDLEYPCILVLPEDKILEFITNEKRIIGYRMPETDYNYLLANAGNKENRRKIIHVVQYGEYFHKIAMHYNCTLENIMAWNNLNNLSLHPGQILEIWIPEDN